MDCSSITNWKQMIEVKIGSVFHRDCLKFCGEEYNKTSSINILVTKNLYQEILRYVTESKNMQCE